MNKDTAAAAAAALHPTFYVLHWFHYHKSKIVSTLTQLARMNLATDELSTFLADIINPHDGT
jgi:hypothetical protein